MKELFNANKSLLNSMLLDEGKLITYISISRDLCVHVNISKIMLQHLVDYIRQKTPDVQLNVSYIISGATEDNNAQTIVCLEKDLSREKECFNNIFFEHIYSVTKGSPSIDTAAYLIVNKFEDLALCSGMIKSKQCDKRSTDEIGDLKASSQDVVMPENNNSCKNPTIKKSKQATNANNNNTSKIKFLPKDIELNSEKVIKQELISPKKETVGVISPKKSKVSLTNGQKTQKGITGFFNKTNSNIKKEVKEKMHNGEDTTKTADEKCEKMEIEATIPKENIEIGNKKSDNTMLQQIKRTSKVDKKRKRVLHISDSDSDNENNDPFVNNCTEEQDQGTADSEDEIPPTPTVSNIAIKSGILNPKKRRKFVDKTYTDEDGYILTKKTEVYESCSENEEETKVQEKPSQTKIIKNDNSPKDKIVVSKKKVSPPQKSKQATLTNFFKKV